MIVIIVVQTLLMACQLAALLYLDKKAQSDAPKGCPLRLQFPEGHPMRRRISEEESVRRVFARHGAA